VTVPVKRRAPAGVRLHTTKLEPAEITRRGRIPVTTPARTLLDMAGQVPPAELERTIREAIYLRLTGIAALTSCLSAHQGRRGAKTMRAALAKAQVGKGRTRSELEQRFLAMIRKHRLPAPDLNVSMMLDRRPVEVDCMWRDQRLIVELDGAAAHATPHAFETDRARDLALQAASWRVARITWRQLLDEPGTVAAKLRQFFAPASGSASAATTRRLSRG
jgi:very-short-patch-repair endonuclease